MMPYEKFEAWQVAHELALEIYRATDGWPREERYGLTIQLRRAAFVRSDQYRRRCREARE
jgi:four helix bundle protein